MLTSNLFIGMLISDVLFGGSFPFSILPAPQKHPLTGTSVELSWYWGRRNLHKNLLPGVRDIFGHTFLKFHLVLWHAAVLDFLQDNIFVQRSICLPPWSSQWQPGQEWTWIQFSLCKVVFSVSVGCSWVWFLLQAAGGGTLQPSKYTQNTFW